MVINKVSGGVCAPKGFVAGGIHCGIRKNQSKKDLAIIFSEKECSAAAVYTQNKVLGAPILVTRSHIADGKARAVVCNSGNANTCNADGVEKATIMCRLTADALGIKPSDVIIASTGVIGQPLDMEPIEKGIMALAPTLSADGSSDAAEAIMTTDTRKKECAVTFRLGATPITIGGMAKGSGMICPNMATLLCFITSDAAISADMLKAALDEVVDDTFNMLSIDGDTSTNDMVSIMANGIAGNAPIDSEDERFNTFVTALKMLATELTRMLAADGEGATKLLQCSVSGAPSKDVAKKVAKSIINSSLVKTAIFGADANWGRILCAIGYADANFKIDCLDVYISSEAGQIQVCKDGFGLPFSEPKAKEILLKDEILVDILMNQGDSQATAWGCDLTYDYVRINGDYRT
ncbi:MAG TPA: bifunctional ornithine acetyltransferase/N-acetylglutamate synthase [Clostridiales bacterium]|jgi:glutamate N-acetyltransferase/amino-acid N-acetyltransferase|nr:bifunctional ornithine acetyltransferase/N-acetylglutamate synthase [Clostridiales bacterium]